MAVLGGSFISRYLSERVIGIVGGVLFLVFALTHGARAVLARRSNIEFCGIMHHACHG